MTTCTLLNALRASTAALPLILATAALGQADTLIEESSEDSIEQAEDTQQWPQLPLNEMRMGTLEEGDRVTGNGHFVDAFDVELAAGKPYRLEVVGQDFTALIFLSTVDGSEIDGLAFDPDDTGFIFTVSRAGTYRVGAMTAQPGASGMYMVGFGDSDQAPTAAAGRSLATNTPGLATDERQADDQVDDAGGDAGAGVGVEGMQMIQAVMDGGDIELDDGRFFAFHAVELTAGTTYTIDVSSNDFDVVGYLFDAADNQLDTNDDAPQMGTNARMTFTPDTAGTYAVGVSTTKPGQNGGYQVTVTPQNAAHSGPGEEIEDAPAAAVPTVHINNQVEATGEQAYFSSDVQLEVGQVIVVETLGLAEGCDTIIQLRKSTSATQVGENDPIVAENDDDQGLLSSRLVYTVQEAGSYYVAASVYEDNGGAFTLLVRDAYPAREPIALEVEIEKDGQVLLGDFEFDTAQNWIVIDTLDLAQGVDTVVELRKTVDPEVASDDDPVIATNDDFFSNDLSSRLYFNCEEPGLYYLRVQNIGKSTGTCTVRIRFEQ